MVASSRGTEDAVLTPNTQEDDLALSVLDVGLDGPQDLEEPTIGNLTRSDEHPGGVVIYPHGFSARYRLNISKAAAQTAFGQIDWEPDAHEGWKTSVPKAGWPRHVMRSPAWIVHRAPTREGRSLTRLNSRWKTRLYNIVIEETAVGYELDIDGVRLDDVRCLFERVLGLKRTDYELRYYRRFERYVVLDPVVAFRLASAYGGEDRLGGGRLGRKRFLINERRLPIPIKIRKRATAYPIVTLYRIEPSATSNFRLEVRLQGNRASRGEFAEADIARLDEALLDLVETFSMGTTLKPARWEPRNLRSRVERAQPDPHIGRLPLAAYQGRRPSSAQLRQLRNCHTLDALRLVATSHDDGAFPPPSRVRRAESAAPIGSLSSNTALAPEFSSDMNAGTGVAVKPSASWKRMEGSLTTVALYRHADDETRVEYKVAPTADGLHTLAREIARARGYMTEVVINAQESPLPLLQTLLEETGKKVGVGVLALVDANGHPDMWQPLAGIVDRHPIDNDIEWLVLVFDPSIATETEDAAYTFDEDTLTWLPRPGVVESGRFDDDATPRSALPIGAHFWNMLADLRQHAERTGFGIVLVTTDFRRPSAFGEMKASHFYTDARVRSLLGDAGRYLCHQRYRIEPDGGIVTIKDGIEGKTGRQLWH